MAVTGSTRNRFVLLIAGHVGSNPTLSARVFMVDRFSFEKKQGEMSELAEGARLEIACTANRGTEGSNPSLSAIYPNMLSSLNFAVLRISRRADPPNFS